MAFEDMQAEMAAEMRRRKGIRESGTPSYKMADLLKLFGGGAKRSPGAPWVDTRAPQNVKPWLRGGEQFGEVPYEREYSWDDLRSGIGGLFGDQARPPFLSSQAGRADPPALPPQLSLGRADPSALPPHLSRLGRADPSALPPQLSRLAGRAAPHYTRRITDADLSVEGAPMMKETVEGAEIDPTATRRTLGFLASLFPGVRLAQTGMGAIRGARAVGGAREAAKRARPRIRRGRGPTSRDQVIRDAYALRNLPGS